MIKLFGKSVYKKDKKYSQRYIQDLFDIKKIDDWIIESSNGEGKYFIRISPQNINILQNNVLENILNSFKFVCNLTDKFEILVVDKIERLEENQKYVESLSSKTDVALYKDLLNRDGEFLRKIQTADNAGREFFMVFSYTNMVVSLDSFKRIENVLNNEGFNASICTGKDLKSMLQVYFERNFNSVLVEEELNKSFLDMILPSVVKFYSNYYIFGNTYRRVFAIRNYQLETDKMAILRKFGERNNITLKIYANKMSNREFETAVEGSINKNYSEANLTQFVAKTQASKRIETTEKLVKFMSDNPTESMFSVSVFVEVIGNSLDEMNKISDEVITKLDGITYDNLFLQQKEGFLSVHPIGRNLFKDEFDRHMPSSSLSNLFPFSYSGCTDKEGFYLGNDKHGGHVIVDFDKRNSTHTNSNILIIGNSGEGKSFLMKLIKLNYRLKGRKIICLDPDHEYKELTESMGGTFMNLMSGSYVINLLEPKRFFEYKDEESSIYKDKESSILNHHISFLRDFFRVYKDFENDMLDCLEIFVSKVYTKFNISDNTDLHTLLPDKFPILSDLYKLIKKEYDEFDSSKPYIYTKETLQRLLLGLNSICGGTDSRFFNGYTNITNRDYITFGVKDLLEVSINLRNAILFNILSFMTNKLLVEGETVAFIDELYLFLENPILVKYIRNFSKRVRKKDSSVVLASQNVEDFLQPEIEDLTKPLFSIPTYRFLFYPGVLDINNYMNVMNITESEFKLIRKPSRGNCLFASGINRFNLSVFAPKYKELLFGSGGGR